MNFQKSKKDLFDIFKRNNFIAKLERGELHTTEEVIENFSNGTSILISFPGRKSSIQKNIYDYLVYIIKNNNRIALSHTNIITDIFNKIEYGGMSAENLRRILIAIAQQNQNNIDIGKIKAYLPYNLIIPSSDLILRVKKAHGDKSYNSIGNSFDLTIEELLACIKWIALQEDINYPIAKKLKGRKMPFARYLETIFITQNNSHNLEEVIERALMPTIPPEWKEMDYSFENLIK